MFFFNLTVSPEHFCFRLLSAARRRRGAAAVQPRPGDGGNPEVPRCYSRLQLHAGSNVRVTLVHPAN